MEWVIILGLMGWVWWQSRRIREVSQRLDQLESKLRAALEPAAASAPVAPAAAPVTTADPDLEPLLLTDALPDDVLVLDTPLPAASNDDAPLLDLTETLPPIPEAARPPPRQRARADGPTLEQWIAENGLAWMGGGALALGGILMVAFAAQQSWFTPAVRIGCGVGLGVVFLGLSEHVLRRPAANMLAAALLAASGAVAFYAAAWGAHAIYGFIDWRAAAALLALCAVLLIGLSFRHGQALGVLALIAALATPSITTLADWAPGALTLFICAVGATGFALAALQRWAWVAAVTLAGLYFWFASAIAEDNVRRALALLSFASLGGVALAFRKPLADEAPNALGWRNAHAYAPAIAICISSVAMIWTWLTIAPSPSGSVAGPAWVGAMFVALAAAATRARVAPAMVTAVAALLLVGGFLIYLRARAAFGPWGTDFYAFACFCAVWITGSALGARPHRRDRALIAAACGVGAALLTLFAALSQPVWASPPVWAPLFASAAMLLGAAWFVSREAGDPTQNLAVDFWAVSGAALLLIGVESLLPGLARSAGHASIALTLAAGFAWRGWRGLRWGALAASALALLHALTGPLIGATLAALSPLWQALLTLGVGAGFLFCASFILARRAPRSLSAEALSAGGIVLALTAAFLGLRWLAQGGVNAQLDAFSETALRALALMIAGHAALPRAHQETGRIGAWRGHALVAAGFGYLFYTAGLMSNPWWGALPATSIGPPLFGGLALAFAAPAAVLLFAAHRLYTRQRVPARFYAGAGGVLALMWAVLEIRRGFHGVAMAQAPVGALEGACYALLFLATALVIAIAARVRVARGGPLGEDLMRIMRGCAWAGLLSAGLILLALRHPWWGGQVDAPSSAAALGLAVLAQALAVALALLLGRALSVDRGADTTRFAAAAAAAVFAWSFGHAAIRWLYHGGGADEGAALIGLEGFAHALWPLAFVLAASAITERAPGRDTIRSYLYDLQALWAAAIWPGVLLAAIGLWFAFNPWWGGVAAKVTHPLTAGIVALCLLIAAWFSAMAADVPHVGARSWLRRVAQIAAVGHVIVAVTLVVRAAFNDGAIAPGLLALGVEMWTYSAVWVLFGAAVLGVGVWRENETLRWCGLIVLMATTLKVFLVDMDQLSGVIRVASFLALGSVLLFTAMAMRRSRLGPGPGEGGLTLMPSAPRETPDGPR